MKFDIFRKSLEIFIKSVEKIKFRYNLTIVMGTLSGFGGLGLSMLASGNQVRGFELGPSEFSLRKNSQHAFLWRGNKVVGSMSQIFGR
jgi:hypothetical protein